VFGCPGANSFLPQLPSGLASPASVGLHTVPIPSWSQFGMGQEKGQSPAPIYPAARSCMRVCEESKQEKSGLFCFHPRMFLMIDDGWMTSRHDFQDSGTRASVPPHGSLFQGAQEPSDRHSLGLGNFLQRPCPAGFAPWRMLDFFRSLGPLPSNLAGLWSQSRP